METQVFSIHRITTFHLWLRTKGPQREQAMAIGTAINLSPSWLGWTLTIAEIARKLGLPEVRGVGWKAINSMASAVYTVDYPGIHKPFTLFKVIISHYYLEVWKPNMAAFSAGSYTPMSDSLSNEVYQLDSAQKSRFFFYWNSLSPECQRNIINVALYANSTKPM